MSLRFNQLPGWEFQVEEVSAGVYRVTGRGESGQRIEYVGSDPDAMLDHCKSMASAGVGRMLHLSDKWAPVFLNERETGMGYHVVTIRLKDGRRFDGVTVTGGIIASIDGNDDVPFSESDIAAIAVTHDRGKRRGTQEPASKTILDEASPMTASQSSGRHEFFVCHDYGQGGLWAIVHADSAEQVHQRFPGLQVFTDPPPMLDEGAIAAIRRGAAVAVEGPPVGWLADYLREID